MEGIIYIRDNDWFKQANVLKVGITTSIHNRESTYKTGEVKLGHFSTIIKVPTDKLHFVDMELKERLKPYHIYYDGGTEFYTRDILDKIIENLKDLKIKYIILSNEEIKKLKHKHKKHHKKHDEEKHNEEKHDEEKHNEEKREVEIIEKKRQWCCWF
jgi:hypothetical protein